MAPDFYNAGGTVNLGYLELDVVGVEPMTDCEGGKYDPNSNLCWQDPPSETVRSFAEAVSDCSALGIDWRLPTISELRTLFRVGVLPGCEPMLWDLSWTAVPTGHCGVWDNCLSFSACYDESTCESDGCEGWGGPAADGCKWDVALSGNCYTYFSSSEYADYAPDVWTFNFVTGHLSDPLAPETLNYVRCVRDGP